MKLQVDINCDLGESYGVFKIGDDKKIMPHITSANIACGFHAGDPTVIMQTVKLAKKHNVAIGAHPAFPDLMGFGRREMQLANEEIKDYVIYQAGAIQGFATTVAERLQHVKPHGALYNMATKNEKISKAIAEAVKALDKQLIIFAPPNSALAKAAKKAKLRVAHEFFADRAYNLDGSLVSRKDPRAIISKPREVVNRAIKAVTEKRVICVNGETLAFESIHTICVHGDSPSATKLVVALKKGLEKAKVKVTQVGNFV
ncbi:MAG: 5-oxoprolinase subunit PxpA [Candidatus Bathyarchaeia archaeon]